jgi:cytoskeletal protein CcmA (bactofilin family)
MGMFGTKSKPNSRIDTLIGAGTTIEGNVTFTGGLRIDGEVRGNVCVAGDHPGTLVLSEHARIDGEVAVPHLVINLGAIVQGRLLHRGAGSAKTVELKLANTH